MFTIARRHSRRIATAAAAFLTAAMTGLAAIQGLDDGEAEPRPG
jgi:hypothetical protein